MGLMLNTTSGSGIVCEAKIGAARTEGYITTLVTPTHTTNSKAPPTPIETKTIAQLNERWDNLFPR